MNAKTQSLWQATAVAGPKLSELKERIDVDVAVIGGGVTGLSAALHLRESGVRVAVLEAEDIGWGASGLNGGQVIPGLKLPPKDLNNIYGESVGRRVAEVSGSAADIVFDIIEKYDLNCSPVRAGWIKAAHSDRTLAKLTAETQELADSGTDVGVLSANEIGSLIGSKAFVGGAIDRRAGTVQPLSYCRELCSAILNIGARVYTQTRASLLEKRSERWSIRCLHGEVRASRVILATNAYTDKLWPKLSKTIFPMNSFQVCTPPLEESLQKKILGGGHAVSDSHRMLFYFRKDPDGRLVIGGDGGFNDRPTLDDASVIANRLHQIFPEAKNAGFEYVWTGLLAISPDYLPRLIRLDPEVYAGLGYTGRGMAMGTLMGKFLADAATGVPDADIPFPITPIKPVRFHQFHRPFASLYLHYLKITDSLDDRTNQRRSAR